MTARIDVLKRNPKRENFLPFFTVGGGGGGGTTFVSIGVMLGGEGTNGSALTSGKRGGLPTSFAFNFNDTVEKHLTPFNVHLEVAILIIVFRQWA